MCGSLLHVQAQKLALEKTYTITNKAKRGYLDEVTYDPGSKITKLSFVTKATNNFTGSKTKVKYQDYFFDKDFSFIKMDENEDVYRNKKYKGDNYSVEGISLENNMMGTFVMRKKLTTYTWDWFFGGYKKKVKLLDKVKPKDDSGNKYTLIRKFENDETGHVIAMVKAKGKGANPNEYIFLKIDNALNFTVTDKAAFEDPQVVADAFLISRYDAEQEEGNLDEEDDGSDGAEESDDQGDLSTSDAGFVFAPSMLGKRKDSDPHQYTFWRVTGEGKIVQKTSITAKASVWNINQAIDTGESLYIFGPGNEGKFYDQTIKGAQDLESMKWKLFQLVKITKGTVEYVTVTDLDEFEAKLKTPPSQKRSPSYRGKKFHFTTADLYHDGSIIISGQNYSWVTQNKVKRKSYKDVMTFYFDAAGSLKSQFGVRREENNSYAKMAPAAQRLNIGNASIYWTIMEMDGIRTEREGKYKAVKALIYPSVARIDPTSGDIGDFVQFGLEDGKPHYYLHNGNPILPMSQENAIVYLGVDKPGKVLWFGKVVLD